jgi:hypothetical protein
MRYEITFGFAISGDLPFRLSTPIYLRDLYVAWRTLEGLPVRAPYEEEYLGKKHSA